MSGTDKLEEVHLQLEEMRRELERLRKENAELRRLSGVAVVEPTRNYHARSEEHRPSVKAGSLLTADSSTQEKIALFRNLFRGREDVHAVFWTNERSGKKGYSPAVEDPWNTGKGKPKRYLPLTDQVIHDSPDRRESDRVLPTAKRQYLLVFGV